MLFTGHWTESPAAVDPWSNMVADCSVRFQRGSSREARRAVVDGSPPTAKRVKDFSVRPGDAFARVQDRTQSRDPSRVAAMVGTATRVFADMHAGPPLGSVEDAAPNALGLP